MNISVAVLMGGPSSEREVSINTGKAMVTACRKLDYETVSIEFKSDIYSHFNSLKNVDVVLLALHGGIGENGCIQGMLDTLGISYTGSNALSSAMCIDKHISKLLAEKVGVKTPEWQQIQKGQSINKSNISFPVVIKPNSEGSTVGLTIVEDETNFETGVKTAFKYDNEILIENYIEGKEITVSILGKQVLPIVEIHPMHGLYDYESKYTKGLTEYICPAELPENLTREIQETALKIFKLLKCRHYGRVDFRLDENNKYWFLELNTLPGMTDTSLVPKAAKAIGITFEQLIESIVHQALNI